jgi:hypothetical protein
MARSIGCGAWGRAVTFEFPLRARCIWPDSFFRIGEEVKVLRMFGPLKCVVEGETCQVIVRADHFKPVVRVKAKCGNTGLDR